MLNDIMAIYFAKFSLSVVGLLKKDLSSFPCNVYGPLLVLLLLSDDNLSHRFMSFA